MNGFSSYIDDLRRAGLSIRQIATEADAAISTVYRWQREATRKPTSRHYRNVVALWAARGCFK